MPVIKVLTSGHDTGSHIMVSLNGHEVAIQPNAQGSHRGLNLIVVDPTTHKVVNAQTYDTHGTEEDNGRLQEALRAIPANHIVAMAACDEATGVLNEDTTNLIE